MFFPAVTVFKKIFFQKKLIVEDVSIFSLTKLHKIRRNLQRFFRFGSSEVTTSIWSIYIQNLKLKKKKKLGFIDEKVTPT